MKIFSHFLIQRQNGHGNFNCQILIERQNGIIEISNVRFSCKLKAKWLWKFSFLRKCRVILRATLSKLVIFNFQLEIDFALPSASLS